jgi:hypothetical protein
MTTQTNLTVLTDLTDSVRAECAQCAELDAALANVCDERDEYAALLDAMTAAAAAVLYRRFGEQGDPNTWRAAITALKGLEA